MKLVFSKSFFPQHIRSAMLDSTKDVTSHGVDASQKFNIALSARCCCLNLSPALTGHTDNDRSIL